MQEIFQFDLTTLSQKLKSRELSVVELITAYLNRIDRYDPEINSFISVDWEGAMVEAEQRDVEISKGEYRGPLHGIPVAFKDNIDTKNLPTTMGSKLYENHRANADAFAVQSLKQAGAIVIGKNNTEQFAYGVTGDQSYFGAVKNPYDLSKCTGGSSSGSTASVAAGLTVGSIGTDTGGSTRIPSSLCGVVGMKPTYDRVSNRDVYPVSQALDHLGPITRSVRDNAIVLNGLDHSDDFTRLIDQPLQKIKIGVPRHMYEANCDEEICQAIDQNIKRLEEAGFEVVDVHLENHQSMIKAHDSIRAKDAYQNNRSILERYDESWFVPEIRSRLLSGKDVSEEDYQEALKIQANSDEIFQKIFNEVDVVILPTVSYMAPSLNERTVTVNGEEVDIGPIATILTRIMNLSGHPALTMPSGLSSNGMPIGLQIVSQKNNEALIYQIATRIEEMNGSILSPYVIN